MAFASNSQFFGISRTIFHKVSQKNFQYLIPFLKLTWAILHEKSTVTITSSIRSTDSLTAACGSRIARNYNQINVTEHCFFLKGSSYSEVLIKRLGRIRTRVNMVSSSVHVLLVSLSVDQLSGLFLTLFCRQFCFGWQKKYEKKTGPR